ncbi:hypothetical protein P691DRAFT_680783 [Macrolepiota fuliginosa MF-IS2]|uniref:Uncharacterized protein n=1 Tax=Macrolepiota fuliginosa MF-IS2 TaxID=1400762 RepID=A0A9P5X102_9AGAR|nr:hypothetical protein P691DRAFT_680783 [Macrolepiota fuliginosa MF-IS2]
MLRLCSGLREASVRVMRIEESTAKLIARIPETRLPKLKSLLIRFESTTYHGRFMEPFELPSLRTLQTRFDWRNDTLGSDDMTGCYAELISRSACPIQRLYIGRNSLELDLERLLEVAKGLRELSVADHVRVPGEVWDRIGRGEIGLRLDRLGVSVATVDPLLSMLEARMGVHRSGVCSGDMAVSLCCVQEPSRMDVDGVEDRFVPVFKEMKLGCPKPSFQQRWRMECLEKLGLRIVLCHYGFFER